MNNPVRGTTELNASHGPSLLLQPSQIGFQINSAMRLYGVTTIMNKKSNNEIGCFLILSSSLGVMLHSRSYSRVFRSSAVVGSPMVS